MVVIFQDNFNRPDSDNVGSNWAADGTGGFDLDILSNRLRFVVAVFSTMEPTVAAAHAAIADCSVSVEQHSSSGDGGPCARALGEDSDTTPTAYGVDAFGTSVELHRFNNSSTPTILTSAAVTRAVGDEWKIEAVGTDPVVLKMYQNGTQRGSTFNDSSASRITAAGRSGIITFSQGANGDYDNFVVDDLQGSPPPPAGTNKFWLLELPETARQYLVNKVTSMLVEAPDEAAAKDLSSSRFAGDPSWAVASATELSPGIVPDYGGFSFRIAVSGLLGSPDVINLAHVAPLGQSLDNAMAALVIELNRHPLVNGASWTAGTKTLLVAPGANGLGDRRLQVDVTPPGHRSPALSFIGVLTHQGAAGSDLSVQFVNFLEVPNIVAELRG